MKHLVKIESHKDYSGIIDFNKLDIDNFFDFDYYRIVNPITKEVYTYDNQMLKKIENHHCYDIWGTGKCCQYCVSTEALLTSTTRRKLEQIDGSLFLAKVFPISIENEVFVLELFQNIGDSYVKTKNENIKLSHIIGQLNDLASIETFSGLLTHGFMYNKLIEITRENTLPVSLICMDIDKMKYINDTFGHFTGDSLIKTIANNLNTLKQDNIFPGRTGGDEFQILYYGYTKQEALQVSQTVLNNIKEIPIQDNYNATISWAIGEREDGQSSKDFMNLVDREMYKVKEIHHKN